MSEANVELVRRGIENVERFWAMLDDHVVWDLRARRGIDLEDIYCGREAVIKASRRYWGTWDDYHLDAEELIDVGTSVVVILRERGRGKASGASFDDRYAQVWTFSSGRVVRWEIFPDRAAALAAVGLDE